MSEFFGSMLPSRSAQVEFGRAARAILRRHTCEYRESLAAAVIEMPSVTRWPEAGVELVYRCTADLLLHPEGSPELRRLLERNARVGALRPARMAQRARAQLLRAELSTVLNEQIRERRSATGRTMEASIAAVPSAEVPRGTSASSEPSCGSRDSNVAASEAGSHSPPMRWRTSVTPGVWVSVWALSALPEDSGALDGAAFSSGHGGIQSAAHRCAGP